MKIVIAGAGEVGSHLAKLLSFENQDIVLVDQDGAKLATLDANYNLMTSVGRPTSIQSLRDAGVENCDLFIAVTPYETTNIVSCSIAKQLGAERTSTLSITTPRPRLSVASKANCKNGEPLTTAKEMVSTVHFEM